MKIVLDLTYQQHDNQKESQIFTLNLILFTTDDDDFILNWTPILSEHVREIIKTVTKSRNL